MNRNSFFKFQNESRIDSSRKFENRAYPSEKHCAASAASKVLILIDQLSF